MAQAFFTLETYHFLTELGVHNEREWFNANKQRYEDHVREPARALIRAMAGPLEALSPHFVADDRKVGGSLMRIYRDTRFSKDKRPYKTNVGVQFRHARGKDVHAPGFYMHLAPDETFVGVGMWKPDSASLNAIRAKIDAEQDRWREITGDPKLSELFSPGGESLKRPPRGYAKDHPLIADLKRKSHIWSGGLAPEEAISSDLPALLVERFGRTRGS